MVSVEVEESVTFGLLPKKQNPSRHDKEESQSASLEQTSPSQCPSHSQRGFEGGGVQYPPSHTIGAIHSSEVLHDVYPSPKVLL